MVPKLVSGSLEAVKFSSKLLFLIGIIIIIVESGIISKERFLKLKDIINILLERKKPVKYYTNLPIPDELPFEIRISPESKTIITMPNWIKTAIPIFKFGQKTFKNKQQKNKSGQTDQNDYNLIKELLKLSELKEETDTETFNIDLKDIKNLVEEFLD